MKNTVITITALALAALPIAAAAHEGHGLPGAHWHATDAWGFVAAGVAAAIAVWYFRRK